MPFSYENIVTKLFFFLSSFSTMPSDSMDDIELKNIQLQFPSARSLSRDDSTAHEETVETDRGPIIVAVQGSRNKPAIVTYHDLGLNCTRRNKRNNRTR